jgi:hypothetical protein
MAHFATWFCDAQAIGIVDAGKVSQKGWLLLGLQYRLEASDRMDKLPAAQTRHVISA